MDCALIVGLIFVLGAEVFILEFLNARHVANLKRTMLSQFASLNRTLREKM